MPTTATWKPIAGYEGAYSVSRCGLVRSEPRTITTKAGWTARHQGRVLKPKVMRYGHLSVNLSLGNVQKMATVHQLVLKAFVGPKPDGMECCHINGKAADNRVENLVWDTAARNGKDRISHKVIPRGEGHYRTTLTDADVLDIRARIGGAETQRVIAASHNVSPATVCRIGKRVSWTHVG